MKDTPIISFHSQRLHPSLVRAVRDDWDELLGQIENLLEEREQALLESRELQDAQNTMDDDLEDFVKELEKIEAAEASLTDKVNQLKNESVDLLKHPEVQHVVEHFLDLMMMMMTMITMIMMMCFDGLVNKVYQDPKVNPL